MLIRRFYDDRLAQASYLIGCQRTGEALVVDPARNVSPYVQAARQEQLRITRVTETHIHADFLSGTRELASRTDATPLLSAEGGPDWQYRWAASDGATLLHDGDAIVMGGVRVTAMHTPGHTPEHLSFLLTDIERSEAPVALLSGDFLFVGDVGRPDLLERAAGVANSAEPAAHLLYRSLKRLADLPDYLQIWPGHGAGSACGKALGDLPTSTLGYERRTNWALGIGDEATFVASVLAGQPPSPPYFARMKQLNRDGPPLLGTVAIPELDRTAFAAALERGVVIDVRTADSFARGHIAGTLNIPLNRSFTRWAGWLLPWDRDLFLLSPEPAATADATSALASIGLDRVQGCFGQDVLTGFQAAGAMKRTHRESISEAPELARSGHLIVDVRDLDEWQAGHLAEAVHHPLGDLAAALRDTPRGKPIALHCESGSRSAIGASLLETMGFTDVIDLTDGLVARQPDRQ